MIVGLQQANKTLLKEATLGTFFSLIIGYRRHLRVVGSSMEKTLYEGDLIIYKRVNQKRIDLEIGNIVVSKHPKIKNKLIIKRIHGIYKNGIDLRGDNSSLTTDSRHWGLIRTDLIIGKVEKIIPR